MEKPNKSGNDLAKLRELETEYSELKVIEEQYAALCRQIEPLEASLRCRGSSGSVAEAIMDLPEGIRSQMTLSKDEIWRVADLHFNSKIGELT
ncbi:MAG TPA: hypothetical protein VF803_02085 [Candidatus Paceibacterota bacterium]